MNDPPQHWGHVTLVVCATLVSATAADACPAPSVAPAARRCAGGACARASPLQWCRALLWGPPAWCRALQGAMCVDGCVLLEHIVLLRVRQRLAINRAAGNDSRLLFPSALLSEYLPCGRGMVFVYVYTGLCRCRCYGAPCPHWFRCSHPPNGMVSSVAGGGNITVFVCG